MKKKCIFIGILSLLTASLFTAEFAIRYLDKYIPINTVPTMYTDVGGIRNWPSYRGCYNLEGYSCYSINKNGWRDVEHKATKDPGVYRIAILGDSYVEALQVDIENTFWKILENRLNDEGAKSEVLAFGMSGFDAAQSFQVLISEVFNYSPDLIVFAFLAANDLRDSVRELSNLPWKPYYTIGDNGELLLDSKYLYYIKQQNQGFRKWYRTIRNSSHLLIRLDLLGQFLSSKYKDYRTTRKYYDDKDADLDDFKSKTKINNSAIECQAGLDCASIYSEPDPGTLYYRAWNVTERIIEEMHFASNLHDADFFVLGVTSNDNFKEDSYTEGFNIFYADERMKNFADKHKFKYVSLKEALIKSNMQNNPLHGFGDSLGGGHWNENGHRIASESLFVAVQEIVNNHDIFMND